VAAAPAHDSPGFGRLLGLRRAGWPWRAKQGRWSLRQPNAARNEVWVPAALRGGVCFCPDWHTIYGVVAGPPSRVSLYVSPETTRRGQLVLDRQGISSTMSSLQTRDLTETLPRLLASKTAH